MPLIGVKIVALFVEDVTLNVALEIRPEVGVIVTGVVAPGCDTVTLDAQLVNIKTMTLTNMQENRFCCHRRHRRLCIDSFPLIENALWRSGPVCLPTLLATPMIVLLHCSAQLLLRHYAFHKFIL